MENLYQNKDVQLIVEENKYLKTDVKSLQNILRKLNDRLNFYVTRYGESDQDHKNVKKSKDSVMSRENIAHLNALIFAYDELIEEKDFALKAAEAQLSKAVENLYKLSKEYEDLTFYIENHVKENPDAFGHDKQNFEKILLEERDLLQEDIAILKRHLKKSRTSVAQQENHIKEADVKILELQSENTNLQDQLTTIVDDNINLKETLSNTITVDEHKKAVGECNKLFVKLKHTYSEETDTMKVKVDSSKKNTDALNDKLFFSARNIKALRSQAVSYKSGLRKSMVQQRKQNRILKELKYIRQALKIKLRNLAKVCSDLVKDRKDILMREQEMKKELKAFQVALKTKSSNIGMLSVKIKEERMQFEQKLALVEGQKNAAVLAWKRCSKEIVILSETIRRKTTTDQ